MTESIETSEADALPWTPPTVSTSQPIHWPHLERVIDTYVASYELIAESEAGGEAIYDPTDHERFLIRDAIAGLLADPDWATAWGKHVNEIVAGRLAAALPGDAQILELNKGEVFFSESPSKYPELGHGTQYHAGAPGVLGFARAVLQLASSALGVVAKPPAANEANLKVKANRA